MAVNTIDKLQFLSFIFVKVHPVDSIHYTEFGHPYISDNYRNYIIYKVAQK